MDGSSGQEKASVRVRGFALGPHQTNCYVARVGGACWIIDAGYAPQALIDWVRAEGLTPEALVLTHAHCDHMAGVESVRAAFPGLPVWLHEAEAEWLGDPGRNLSAMLGLPATAEDADRLLRGGERLTLGETGWNVLFTPGHSPGGVTLHCPAAGLAFVGDALFKGSVGRTDFPTSDHDLLMRSIKDTLYALPDETHVLSGHGPATTIGVEKRSNPFVRG